MPPKKSFPPKVSSAAREKPAWIGVEIPASVAKAAKIKAASEGVTIRVIILQGLKALGIPVPASEIGDLRSRKHKAPKS